jgi:hypothetical protein
VEGRGGGDLQRRRQCWICHAKVWEARGINGREREEVRRLRENGGKRGRFLQTGQKQRQRGTMPEWEGGLNLRGFSVNDFTTRVSEEDCDKCPVVIVSDITCRKSMKLGKSLHSIASNYNI